MKLSLGFCGIPLLTPLRLWWLRGSFPGVLERPFCEFNWETNPCDCDYTTELALPRHRIQYFTYRGQRVWDRHSRTDLVFGSTGQSLAPPFGGEGEVEEDLAGPTPNEDVRGLEETEPEPCTTIKHLEEEQQNEMNIHTPESALRSKQCTQEQVGLQETCATVPTNRVLHSESSSTAVDMAEPENQCGENHDDFSSCVGALHVDDDPAVVMNQMEEKKGRPPKKKPTHFVTFRANTPAILSCFEQLQRELTALLPSSALTGAVSPASTSHCASWCWPVRRRWLLRLTFCSALQTWIETPR
uniref:MJ1316 RNA cyclic group end recognition domain-containing protein n=1 Tax=Neogobius melanostomus TaxID=47308 RepID=A0A8C6SX20_9GOBI